MSVLYRYNTVLTSTLSIGTVGNNVVMLAMNYYVRHQNGYLHQVNYIVDMAK